MFILVGDHYISTTHINRMFKEWDGSLNVFVGDHYVTLDPVEAKDFLDMLISRQAVMRKDDSVLLLNKGEAK